MDEVTLGFRAFDVHELLLHVIAARLGYYSDVGMKFGLRDLTFAHEENVLSVACGAALVERAKGGKQKVVFVGTDYPMFWMYGRLTAESAQAAKKYSPSERVSVVEGLRCGRIATFAAGSPPWHFLRALLRRQGLDPSEVELLPVRDDVARLGLLRSGDVDAAVISSAFPPAKVERLGFAPLLFFGDYLRIPTTGLAASEEMIRRQPELLKRIIGALGRSLRAVRECPEDVVKIVGEILGESDGIAQKTYELIAPYFTGDGSGDAHSRRRAVEFANAELAQALREEDVYDFRFVRGT